MIIKKYFLLFFLFTAVLFTACKNDVSPKNRNSSKVFFTKEISPEGVMKVFNYIKDNIKGNVGIKVHFGEEGNSYFVPAKFVEPLCKVLNATLIETNVAFESCRSETSSHLELAHEHGFTFAPIDIIDDGGSLSLPIEGGKYFKTAFVGKNIEHYETIIYFTHFKGHGDAGFGGCIKNASMGMATKKGKRFLHFVDYPKVIDNNCTGCEKCISTCYKSAIVSTEEKDKAVRFLEGLVEYTKPIINLKNTVYFNVVINVTPDCDCSKSPRSPFVPDIGILASTDIVAIEAAAHDLVKKAHKCNDSQLQANFENGMHQIDYAEKLGLGNKNYQLIAVDIN